MSKNLSNIDGEEWLKKNYNISEKTQKKTILTDEPQMNKKNEIE